MELKHTNPNNEIVLARKLDHVELIIWKIVEIAFKNESYKLFFQEDAKIAQKNKIVHDFHITYPNEMSQSFPYKWKFNL